MQTILTLDDGASVPVKIWENVSSPKGVVQLIHGLFYPIAAYDHFARFLNDQGFIVVAAEHRVISAVKACASDRLDVNDFERNALDKAFLTDWITCRYELPIYLIGQSYGAYLLLHYMLHIPLNGCVRGVVLGGAVFPKNFQIQLSKLITLGNSIVYTLCKSLDEGLPNHLVEADAEELFEAQDCADYITRDLYKSILDGISGLFKGADVRDLVDLPVLLLCGVLDEGKVDRHTQVLYRHLQSLGLHRVEVGQSVAMEEQASVAVAYQDVTQHLSSWLAENGKEYLI